MYVDALRVSHQPAAFAPDNNKGNENPKTATARVNEE